MDYLGGYSCRRCVFSSCVYDSKITLASHKVGNFRPLPKSNGFFYACLGLVGKSIEIQEGVHDPEIGDVARSDIEIEDLKFSYPNRNPVFSGLNLTIPAQKTIGLVGSTGSGKTTLTKLLLRFNEISDGKISWSDAPIKEWKLKNSGSQLHWSTNTLPCFLQQ